MTATTKGVDHAHAHRRRDIRAAFERAAHSYDQAAMIQREICARLAAFGEGLVPGGGDADGWVLDAGCGTGFGVESLRRLRPGGRMIYVVPGAEHLYQMKAVLYEKPYKNPVQQVEYPGFRAIDEREVQGTITVPAAQLEALFAMTPYYWKTPRDGAARLAALPQLTTTIAFRFLVFEKL